MASEPITKNPTEITSNEKCLKNFFKEIGTGAYILIFITITIILTKNTEKIILTQISTKNWDIWTILTFPLSGFGFLNTFFHFFFIISWSLLTEKNEGTAYFLYTIFHYAFFQGLVHFVLIWVNLSIIDLGLFSIWPVYFLDISRRCFETPNKISGILFIPYEIKNIYFPFVVFFISLTFNRFVFVGSDISSIFLGFLMMRYKSFFDKFILKKEYIQKIDFFLSFFSFLGTFYKFEEAQEIVNGFYFQKKVSDFINYNAQVILLFIQKFVKNQNSSSDLIKDVEKTRIKQKSDFYLETVKEQHEEDFEEIEDVEMGKDIDNNFKSHFEQKSKIILENSKIQNEKQYLNNDEMFSI